MKILFAIALGFLVFSCSSNETETVKYSDISPNSKPKHEEGIKTDEPKDERPDKSVFLNLIDSVRPNSRWQKWDSILFPDRFGAKFNEKWIVKGQIDSVILIHYSFRDSLLTKNAFYNWMDCFGANCKSYTVGGNIKVKNKYTYFFVGATDIYFFESQKGISQELIRESLMKGFSAKKTNKKDENWLYTVVSKPSGKAVWKKVVDGEEQEIKNWNEDSK